MIELGLFAALLCAGFFFGSARERAHLDELKVQERELLDMAVRMEDGDPSGFAGDVFLVTGSVVIGSDYFKDFVAKLKTLFGGRLGAYESLLDRARREAIVRMKRSARNLGAREIVCARLETAMIEGMGLEVIAYGTAVR